MVKVKASNTLNVTKTTKLKGENHTTNNKSFAKRQKKKNPIKMKKKDAKDIDFDANEYDINKLETKINKFINDFEDEPQNDNEKVTKKQKKPKNQQLHEKTQSKFNKKSNSKFGKKNRVIESRRKSKMFTQNSKSLMIKYTGKWYQLTQSWRSSDPKTTTISRQREYQMMEEAKELIAKDIEVYNHQKENGKMRNDFAWIRTVLHKGTLSDKLAAHTLLIQDSAVHNLASLRSMIEMVNPKGKRECLLAMDNLRELFLGDLLIPNEKLKKFGDLIPLIDETNDNLRKRQLILCYIEDQLKSLYREFLDAVVRVSHDNVEGTKSKSILTFFDLLVNNPENEQFLLQNLINKLGDPIPKLASQTSHFLNQLVNQHHPVMKSVVVQEIERLLYRPNISQKAQYYSLCFLSEMLFRAEDTQLANKMIAIYFGFFKSCIKKGDVNSKMMSAILTGVTRAFPYSKLETDILNDHLETFYKIIHYVNFNTSIQALHLIFNVLDAKESGFLNDRFYCILYRHILDPQLDSCTRKALFLNLVFRALKRDAIHKRVTAFVKRLIQIALTRSPSLACSILILISELFRAKPNLWISVVKRTDNEVKDILKDDDDDAEEKYYDIPLSDEDEDQRGDKLNEIIDNDHENTIEDNPSAKVTKPSWVHNVNIDTNRPRSSTYDLQCRNPLFANADTTALWELVIMIKHFHPSASLFAHNIINKINIDYDGDPLSDFTLKHFLDRFVFRNPKHVNKVKSAAARQRSVFGRLKPKSFVETLPSINSQEYLDQPEVRIPLEERFIYKYLKQHQTEKSVDDDIESVTSEEFEHILDRYEPGDKDFASDFKEGKKKQSKIKDNQEDDIDEDDDFIDEDFDNDVDDDDIDFDDDEEFDAAFEDVDNELEDAFNDNEDIDDEDNVNNDDDDDDEETPLRPKRKPKKGFDRVTSSLFASADEFAELLEQNDMDSDFDDDEDNDDDKDKKSNKRGKKIIMGRPKKKKRQNIDL